MSSRFRRSSDASSAGICDGSDAVPHCIHEVGKVNPQDIIFRGLSVRMAVVSGTATGVKKNAATKRNDYHGELRKLVNALIRTLYGGQIVVDQQTFIGITGPDGGVKVTRLDAYELDVQHREDAPPAEPSKQQTHSGRSSNEHAAASLTPIRQHLEVDLSPLETASSAQPLASDGLELSSTPRDMRAGKGRLAAMLGRLAQRRRPAFQARGLTTLVRHGHSISNDWSSYPHSTTRLAALCNWLQALVQGKGVRRDKLRGLAEAPMCIDMGTHLLQHIAGAQSLMQIAVPGLEERARWYPVLRSISLSPGYFEAPGTYMCPLQVRAPPATLPEVTLVFLSIEGMDAMKAFNTPAVNMALMVFRDRLQHWLAKFCGYECQYVEGDCMLAFADHAQAVMFCLLMQEAMLYRSWTQDISALPLCGAQMSAKGDLTWFGPRVKMGVCKDVPTRIMPHAISGRADYFGSFVNRAARYCFALAHGGQIMLPLQLARQVIYAWTGAEHELTCTGLQPSTLYGHATPMAEPQVPSMAGSLPMTAAPSMHVDDQITAWVPAAGQAHAHAGADPLPDTIVLSDSFARSAARYVQPELTKAPLITTAATPFAAVSSILPADETLPGEPASSASLPAAAATAAINGAVQTEGQMPVTVQALRHRGSSMPDIGLPAPVDWVDGDGGSSSPSQSSLQRPRPGQRASQLQERSKGSFERASASAQSRGRGWDGSALHVSQCASEDGWNVGMKEVEVHHCGLYQFKGLPDQQHMIQINSRRMADRVFAKQPPSRKAKCAAPGYGLQCVVMLQS